jgi:hypothetical protein
MCALVGFLCEIVAVDICLLCSILLNRVVPEFVAYFQTLNIGVE